MIAAQDQSLPTRNYLANIIKKGTNLIYRPSAKKIKDSIDPLQSDSLILTPVEYNDRHDEIGHYIHLKMCKYY